MATSTYQRISWDNDYNLYWSQLYSLYSRAIYWDDQLCNYGYRGYPDPGFETDDGKVVTDLIAFSTAGDTQHFLVECFESIQDSENNYKSGKENVVRSTLEEANRLHDLPEDAISRTINRRGDHDFEPQHCEVVVLVPNSFYECYSELLKESVEDFNLIIWTVTPNGSSIIKKIEGEHSSNELNRVISDGLEAYPDSDNLLQYNRKTDASHLKFAFIKRLVSYCSRERQRRFTFKEVDDIMVEHDPPILGHLTAKTRKEEFWRQFLHSMLNRLSLIEQSDTDRNTYKWKRKKFVTEPRYRRKILSGVKEELEIGDDV